MDMNMTIKTDASTGYASIILHIYRNKTRKRQRYLRNGRLHKNRSGRSDPVAAFMDECAVIDSIK